MKHILLVTIGSILLWSCNTATEQSTAVEQGTVAIEAHEHDKATETVELNNGERWAVNDEMKPFVEQGENLVNRYVQGNQLDFKDLAKKVKEQNDQLIKSCTMDGKSHEELHKWLHPHLELVKDLEQEADNVTAAETVLSLQNSYHQYHQYFK